MKLFYKDYPTETNKDAPAIIIIHGLFGAGGNWHSLSRRFSEKYCVFCLDMRNHGNSPHSDAFTYELMADDIAEFMDDQGLETAHIIGHSMGGKASMMLAGRHPEKIDKLILVDISPRAYPPSHNNVFAAFFAVQLDQISSRQEADSMMAETITNLSVRQFLLKNLVIKNKVASWKMNLDVIHRAYQTVGQQIDLPWPFQNPTLVLAGGKSGYVTDEDEDMIHDRFPQHELNYYPDAGHWIHAEEPGRFFDDVMEFLD